MKKRSAVIINLVLPTLVLGAITGIFTSIVVNVYKLLAKNIIHITEHMYGVLHDKPVYVLVPIALAVVVAFILAFIYKIFPDLKGGGIPTSIAALRGIAKLKWIVNLVGVFVLSLVSFLFGVPLGNEGPSVQMGCAAGGGVAKIWSKNHRAWERYSMTGGSCAGFAVATGAPISGVVFAIEEAHRRISPMILVSAASAVFFAGITTEVLSPMLGVSKALFPELQLPTLTLSKIWIPLIVAFALGVFAVIFLRMYAWLNKLYNKRLKKVPHQLKIFAVFALTVVFGAVSVDFVSTGHELVLHLIRDNIPVLVLLAVLIVRMLLTLSANTNGVTGGVFLPLLALGAVAAAVVAKICIKMLGAGEEYYGLIIVLGLVGCIAAMMKMPLTAVVFSAEALCCVDNIVFVILVAMISYLITEVFGSVSINDAVVEAREEKRKEKIKETLEITLKVAEGSFAAGREISDILWPHGLIILSVHKEAAHGGSMLRAGDTLVVRCATGDRSVLMSELEDILGKQ